MFARLKKTLVSSYIAAIALGWIFAQGILHFAYVFSAPIAGWIARREYRELVEHTTVTGLTMRDSLPELVKSISLLLVGYLLLRWLYADLPAGDNLGDTAPQSAAE